MSRALQPYAGFFSIENYRVNFYSDKFFSLTQCYKVRTKSQHCCQKCKHILLSKLHVTINMSSKCVRSMDNGSGPHMKDKQCFLIHCLKNLEFLNNFKPYLSYFYIVFTLNNKIF